jgi:phosphatidylinositol glycan class S
MVGTRLYTISAFLVQILAILPFAWLLTRVYQAELPFEEISQLSANELEFSLGVHLVLQDNSKTSCGFEGLVDEVTSSFLSLLPPQTRPRVVVSASLGRNETLTQRSAVSLSSFDDELNAQHGSNYNFYVLCADDQPDTLVMGKYRHGWVSASGAGQILKALLPIAQLVQLQLGADVRSTKLRWEKARKKQQLAYRLSFSLINQDPSHPARTSVNWDFPALQKGFLNGFLNYVKASAVALSVDSQVIHYAALLAKRVQEDKASGQHFILQKDLSDLMSSIDWHEGEGRALDIAKLIDDSTSHENSTGAVLGSYSREQLVRFMFLVPSPAHTPLYIRTDTAGDGEKHEVFEVPGWGLVSVVNSVDFSGDGDVLHHRNFATGMGHVVMYCREMLGLKYDQSDSTVTTASAGGGEAVPLSIIAPEVAQRERGLESNGASGEARIRLLPCSSRGMCAWELDLVARLQSRWHLEAAQDSLQALTQLTHSMPHMTVTEEVGALVRRSLRSYHRAQQLIESGAMKMERSADASAEQCLESDSAATCTEQDSPSSLALALSLASDSRQAAETAVSHPSMVPQLYFPPEHLLAVYLPLWAPLALPLLLGFTKELRRFRGKAKQSGA